MLKYLTGTAIIAGLLAIGAAGAVAQQKYTFALVPKNMNNPFFDQARDGCKKAESESNGAFECMYIGPGEHGGGEEQVQIVQDLVAKKVDGIAVSPSNAAAMAVALQAAKEANIPVFTWDSDVLPENNRLVVEGVNFIKRHTKPNPQRQIKGGVVEREAPLHASNVQLLCPECGKPTRLGKRILGDGRKVRICRKCEGVVDK